MATQFDIFTTTLSGRGSSPWDFSLVNGFTAYVGKEFDLAGGNPNGSFVTMILLDTDGHSSAIGVLIPAAIQFANGTQSSPATFTNSQLSKVTFDFSAVTSINFASIHKITIRFQDTASTIPLYCFIDKLEPIRI